MNNLWYLSPSNQGGNLGIGNYGTEQDQMIQLVDEITPHLDRCGVSFHVAERSMTLAQKKEESDRLGAVWYIAFHSNAGGNGQAWGPIAFYAGARDLAERLISELLATGQKNNRAANVVKTGDLYEVIQPKAKACLLEVDFHDSQVGVDFLTNRRHDAAKAIAKAIVAMDGKQWIEEKGAASAWAYDVTQEAKRIGLFRGDESGNYRWQDPITREEVAAIAIRLKEHILKQKGG